MGTKERTEPESEDTEAEPDSADGQESEEEDDGEKEEGQESDEDHEAEEEEEEAQETDPPRNKASSANKPAEPAKKHTIFDGGLGEGKAATAPKRPPPIHGHLNENKLARAAATRQYANV